jgi:hypothetical protein
MSQCADIAEAINHFVHVVCLSIATCRDLQRAISLIQLAANWLLDEPELQLPCAELEDNEPIHAACTRLATVLRSTPPAHQLRCRDAFYEVGFQELAETFLSGMCGCIV